MLLVLLAPAFALLEVVQLVLCERYLGIKQIARGADPRELGLGEGAAFAWTAALAVYGVWILLLIVMPFTRVHGLGLLGVWSVGFLLRRSASLKWVLVILTFEGAVRIGLLISLVALLWHRL